MVGSAVVVLTSVLAGSFYSFDKGNKILETIIKVLPQKAFLSMAELVEQGKSISNWYHYGLYIAALTLFFFVAAVVKARKSF
jgi:ABC-2 type transport system permease protein